MFAFYSKQVIYSSPFPDLYLQYGSVKLARGFLGLHELMHVKSLEGNAWYTVSALLLLLLLLLLKYIQADRIQIHQEYSVLSVTQCYLKLYCVKIHNFLGDYQGSWG